MKIKRPAITRREVGLDVKVAITSSLNLDLTVNPDFSQVEVDRQVTNLDRFELFFPERRQFFLENGDLFANFGYPTVRPFFSRRIGLEAPIRFGARLSGKPNKNWRLGLMNMQTGKVNALGLPAQNFTVASLQTKGFFEIECGTDFINKQSLDNTTWIRPKPLIQTITGISEPNTILRHPIIYGLVKLMFLKSFSPKTTGKDFVQAGHLQYSSRRLVSLVAT